MGSLEQKEAVPSSGLIWMRGGGGSLALVTAEGPRSPRSPGCWGGGKTADGPRCPLLQTMVHILGQSLERKFSLLKAPKPPAETCTCLPSGLPAPSSTSNLHAPGKRKRGSPAAQQTRDPLGFSTELTTSISTQERKHVSRALCHRIRAGPTATPSGRNSLPLHQDETYSHPIRVGPVASLSRGWIYRAGNSVCFGKRIQALVKKLFQNPETQSQFLFSSPKALLF